VKEPGLFSKETSSEEELWLKFQDGKVSLGGKMVLGYLEELSSCSFASGGRFFLFAEDLLLES